MSRQRTSPPPFPSTLAQTVPTCFISNADLIYTSSVSRPDYIKALSVSATNTPTSTPIKSPPSNTISVRKNDVYTTQPLKTLSSLQADDKTVNLSGVLVKAMEVQRCSGGDYKRNIYIVDETMQTPFLISVFFKEAGDGDVFSVGLSAFSSLGLGIPRFLLHAEDFVLSRQLFGRGVGVVYWGYRVQRDHKRGSERNSLKSSLILSMIASTPSPSRTGVMS